jgi:hypothetical protein
VTVGSLQVITCPRLGISLRQPSFKTGTGPLRRNEPRSNGVSRPSPGRGDGSALLQLIKERPEQNSRSAPVDGPSPYAAARVGENSEWGGRGELRYQDAA